MRKVFGALLALASIFGGLAAGGPTAFAAGNYTVSINDTSASEGSPAQFTISLQQVIQSGDTITVDATTSDGTAIGGSCAATNDYVPRTATIVLTQAQPTGTFPVQTCDDSTAEGAETFTATLSNPTIDCGGDTPCTVTIGDGSGTGTIIDNDFATVSPSPSPSASPSPTPTGSPGVSPGPTPPGPTTFTVRDVQGRAGPTQNCRFNVNRDGDASGTSRVSFASSGKLSLVANITGTLVFAPGETVKTVDVDVLRRGRRQRFATLILSAPVNGSIADGIAVCELKQRRHRRR